MVEKTIDLTGDENDDWMKKANPRYQAEELALHKEIEEKHAKKMADNRKGS